MILHEFRGESVVAWTTAGAGKGREATSASTWFEGRGQGFSVRLGLGGRQRGVRMTPRRGGEGPDRREGEAGIRRDGRMHHTKEGASYEGRIRGLEVEGEPWEKGPPEWLPRIVDV